VFVLLIIKERACTAALVKLSQVSFNFLLNEGNVFCNCIMEIHNYRTVDETGFLLLVMVVKGR
jgi:hypothetical protein